MKLHMFPFAPNAAKVRLYLAEKAEAGCPIEVEEVLVNLREGGQKTPEYLALNPLSAVPALEFEDGRVLHESLAIIDYFEELHPEPSMWGVGPYERSYARQIERIADIDGLISIARQIHATNSPLGLPANPDVAEFHRLRWEEKGRSFLESVLSDGRPFLAGDSVTVADCTLQAILQFARVMKLDVLEGAPLLAEWSDRIRERPAAKATILL
jgi:glutathione S-transferase